MITKMNPEIKPLLIAALRSGTYKQGRAALSSDDGFCCLGVACDIHRLMHPGMEFESSDIGTDTRSYLGCMHTLPAVVGEWAGLNDVGNIPGVGSLAFFNDHGSSFSEIADIIEKHL